MSRILRHVDIDNEMVRCTAGECSRLSLYTLDHFEYWLGDVLSTDKDMSLTDLCTKLPHVIYVFIYSCFFV